MLVPKSEVLRLDYEKSLATNLHQDIYLLTHAIFLVFLAQKRIKIYRLKMPPENVSRICVLLHRLLG